MYGSSVHNHFIFFSFQWSEQYILKNYVVSIYSYDAGDTKWWWFVNISKYEGQSGAEPAEKHNWFDWKYYSRPEFG